MRLWIKFTTKQGPSMFSIMFPAKEKTGEVLLQAHDKEYALRRVPSS
jgi:hypothetical protein